jgi:hypothetical protein
MEIGMEKKAPVKKTVDEARAALTKVLQNSTNSSDVESIVKAVDAYVNAKIDKALNNHTRFYHDDDSPVSPAGGNF